MWRLKAFSLKIFDSKKMANRELLNLFSLRALRSLRLLILFFTAEIAEHAEKEDFF